MHLGFQIWSTEQKTIPLRQSKLEVGETLTAACYSRDGACLALGSVHGTMLILDSARLAMLAILRDTHTKKVWHPTHVAANMPACLYIVWVHACSNMQIAGRTE